MKHLNRDFKENISCLPSNLNECNVKWASKVTKEIGLIKDKFDQVVGVKAQTSITQKHDERCVFNRVADELQEVHVFAYQDQCFRSAFQTVPKHPFTSLDIEIGKFHEWIKSKQSELANKKVFQEFCRKKKESVAIAEHSYAHM